VLDRAIDATPAGFEQAAGNDRGDRRDRFRLVGQFDFLLQLAAIVERGIDHIARFLRQLNRGVAEEITRQVFQRLLFHRHAHLRGETIAGSRRAIEISAGRLQLERLTGLEHRVGDGEIELHPLGQEFFDPQIHALHRFGAGRIGAKFHLPAAGRRFDWDQLLETVVTLRARFDAAFDERLAVGLLQAHEQRLRFFALGRHRFAVVIAQ
jgi:hypothetical protein